MFGQHLSRWHGRVPVHALRIKSSSSGGSGGRGPPLSSTQEAREEDRSWVDSAGSPTSWLEKKIMAREEDHRLSRLSNVDGSVKKIDHGTTWSGNGSSSSPLVEELLPSADAHKKKFRRTSTALVGMPSSLLFGRHAYQCRAGSPPPPRDDGLVTGDHAAGRQRLQSRRAEEQLRRRWLLLENTCHHLAFHPKQTTRFRICFGHFFSSYDIVTQETHVFGTFDPQRSLGGPRRTGDGAEVYSQWYYFSKGVTAGGEGVGAEVRCRCGTGPVIFRQIEIVDKDFQEERRGNTRSFPTKTTSVQELARFGGIVLHITMPGCCRRLSAARLLSAEIYPISASVDKEGDAFGAHITAVSVSRDIALVFAKNSTDIVRVNYAKRGEVVPNLPRALRRWRAGGSDGGVVGGGGVFGGISRDRHPALRFTVHGCPGSYLYFVCPTDWTSLRQGHDVVRRASHVAIITDGYDRTKWSAPSDCPLPRSKISVVVTTTLLCTHPLLVPPVSTAGGGQEPRLIECEDDRSMPVE